MIIADSSLFYLLVGIIIKHLHRAYAILGIILRNLQTLAHLLTSFCNHTDNIIILITHTEKRKHKEDK